MKASLKPLIILFSLVWTIGQPRLRAQQNPLEEVVLQPIVTELRRPTSVTHPGDGSGRLFITLQEGLIVVYDGTQALETPFLNLVPKVFCCGERGLLSIAFHPRYESNGLFYVAYTDRNGDTVVSRFRVSEDPNIADPDSEFVLLQIEQPRAEHNGGQLQFGPDGFLYIGTGDGGGSGDPDNRAQNLGTLLGKILRIDVDSGTPYAIPPANPFVDRAGARGEIWAYGLRNPWRFSFDRLTGDLFIGDVGQADAEEIDFQRAGSSGGQNYGWRLMEGNSCFNPPMGCNDGSLTPPILEYRHEGSNCGGSIISGYRYRGSEVPELDGLYIHGDFCSGALLAAAESGGQWTVATRDIAVGMSAFGEDEAGELYLADWGGGAVLRLTTRRPPSLSLLSPSATPAGSPDLVLTLAGSNFVAGSEVRWNGSPRPTRFFDSTRLQVTLSAADLAEEATAELAVVNPSGGVSSETLPFVVTETPALSPAINAGGVVNAADSRQPVAPGSIVSVYGIDLSAGTEAATLFPLSTALAGANLVFNGSLPAPVFFSSPLQVNILIPWELSGEPMASLTANVGGVLSAPLGVPLAAFSPGLFLAGTAGQQGAIVIANTAGALAAPLGTTGDSRPVRRREIVEIFATGLGDVTNRPATGNAARPPLSQTTTEPQVTVGGAPARVFFSGLAPRFVGLYQVNAEIPNDAPSGDQVPLELTIGGVASNTVTIAVE